MFSQLQPFFNPGSYYANTFNVVIRLTGGFVSDVIWDDISLTLSGCTDQCPSPETWTFAANNSVNGNGYDDSDVDQVDNVYGYCSSLVSGTNSALGSTCDVKVFSLKVSY